MAQAFATKEKSATLTRLRSTLTKLVSARHQSLQNCYITRTGRVDGVGCQIQAVLSTLLFAHLNGLTYLHTPFREINQKNEKYIQGASPAGLGAERGFTPPG